MEQDTLTSALAVRLENVERAARTLDGVIYKTLLQHNLACRMRMARRCT
ncbi:hypothetical protein [Hymenobacter sp. AT01-02]|nr:hypothetical protein [Hymenobacter sp. AT01-02]